MLLIFAIPAALTYTFDAAGDTRQAGRSGRQTANLCP